MTTATEPIFKVESMKFFLSGWQATNKDREGAVIAAGWLKWRCFSFANTYKLPGLPYFVPGAVEALEACVKAGVEIMMDSGVVGFRTHRAMLERTQNAKQLAKMADEKTFIKLYVEYVKAYQHEWGMYMTIDLARNASEIFERHKRIEALGIRPVPVFHGDDSVDFIRRYKEELGHELVAIATYRGLRSSQKQSRKYLEAVFNMGARCGVQFHGLAQTSPWQMLEFPWYSVDSSSWSRAAGYGSITRFDEHRSRLSTIHVSDQKTELTSKGEMMKLNSTAMQRLKEELEGEGFDLATLKTDFVQRHIYNSRTMYMLATAAEKRHGQQNGRWKPLF